uniref:Galactose mutarotase n=1 Tax=Athene cunicularia TaxID=194338 RepID=A0A663N5Q6_ATHCN
MTEVKREMFGQMPQEDGGGVVKFILKSDSVKVEILSLGCIITALEMKGRDEEFSDVVLGSDTLEGGSKSVYLKKNKPNQGRFIVDGKEYQLFLNNGPNSLHGGARGFDKVLWSPQVLPNGIFWVTYMLSGGELTINYRVQTSKATPINLTNHAYFNLVGQGSRDIYNHEISIEADSYLPVDDTKVPTGGLVAVQGTGFDLRQLVELGKNLQKFHLDGFDHNFCLQQPLGIFHHILPRAHHPPTGRTMEVHSTQPGIQFYTGNNLDGSLKGKGAVTYPRHSPHLPNTILWPDKEYNHTTWLVFSAA